MITAKERLNDEQETLRNAIEGVQAKIWTALPAKILSADYAKQTLTAQPVVMGKITGKDGKTADTKLPVLVDVPFQSFGGAGFVVTMPKLEGSECLIVFSSRCIDAWWSSGGVQPQAEQRMHDLSDGLAIIGFNSQARIIPNYSTTAVEVRTFDGSTKISLEDGTVTVTAANTHVISDTVTITAPNTHITGKLQVDGEITSSTSVTAPTVTGTTNVIFGGKSGIGHTHSGVTSGNSNTGAPN
jgi:hypothetical protein